MGFAFTILYIVVTIFSPEQFGKEWANYHALMYLAGITALASLPSMANYEYWKASVQTFLLIGFIIAIAMSQVVHGYLGGVIEGLRIFLPSAAVFFFIIVNVTTVRRLKIVTLATVACCLALAVEALCGFYGGFNGEMFVMRNNIYGPQDNVIGQIMRIRGAGFLSDPNDFAQILLIMLPLSFLAWRRGRTVTNFFVVLLPTALILWTVYLTHSRGALVALAAIALMTARKKLGTTTSAILAGVFILGMLALDFTGGRGISAADGADRLEAWANGLEMFKSAPLFGVGFNNFTDLYEITAHNSFVLCLAELGLLGSTLWIGLLVTTTIGLNRIIGGKSRILARKLYGFFPLFEMSTFSDVGVNVPEMSSPFSDGTMALENAYAHDMLPPLAEGNADGAAFETNMEAEPVPLPLIPRSWVVAMRLGLIAFMMTAWFLSRSYTTTMYLVLGLATATIALHEGPGKQSDRGHWVFSTVTVEFVMIFLIYCLVRFRH